MSAVYRSALTVSFSLAALFASPLASAQDSVPGLKGLQGLNQHDAGRKLSASGYVRQSGSGDYGSWWNAREHRCVMVHSDRGHVQTAVPPPRRTAGRVKATNARG